ncbi:VanZ family protein [Pediococcus claussenii]|uniref:VanZ like family protein n=1 Tax=Pediococcus claussenii (strain ATCC BAA-344 / DSM 14800 / JCM 18046 / KCTC 3811 / LMG 21948 / P06) TaxID=701521 RepID=G8PDZ6_PEDCP|nr:VanZ family protein [Pediococcus claussenii]AEV95481.1 vanZ like family protein [Pediococcus claussenii ATCC BAA-344]ANZ69006.1 antibiotic resistance protein VanZ [Pediococcus claussenii]ANZ70822.1 antibiotic resistance protein VanZ [Pediococcus claussenii]KRN20282.1 hypothetical protein IV79_GL000951 [Pediococcus claussenii]
MQNSIQQYVPFLILLFLVIISIVRIIGHNPKLVNTIVFGSLGVYLICVFWLIFTPGLYYLGDTYYMRYFWFGTAKIVYVPAGLTSEGSIMNMIMTLPAGVYLRLLLPNKVNKIPIVFMLAISIGLFNEGGQFILDLLVNIQRTVDITDVITNSIGVILGWGIAFLIRLKHVDLWKKG